MSEGYPFFSVPYQGSDAAHASLSASSSAEHVAFPFSLAAAADSQSPALLAAEHRLPRLSSAAVAQQLSPTVSHSRHVMQSHSQPQVQASAAAAGASATATAAAAPAVVSLRGSRGAAAKHAAASGPPQPPLVPDGTVCGNALCASPFALGAAWQTRTIPGRGAVRLCAGCACEVDKRRVCEVCREIYVAAKATPQSTNRGYIMCMMMLVCISDVWHVDALPAG